MSLADQLNLTEKLKDLNVNDQGDQKQKKQNQYSNFTDQDQNLDETIIVGYNKGMGQFIDKLEIFLQEFVNNPDKDEEFIGNLKVMQRKLVHKICDRFFIERQHIKKTENEMGDITIVKTPQSRIPTLTCKEAFNKYFSNQNQNAQQPFDQSQQQQQISNQPQNLQFQNPYMPPQFQMDQMFQQPQFPQQFYPQQYPPFVPHNPYIRMPPQFGFGPVFQQPQNFMPQNFQQYPQEQFQQNQQQKFNKPYQNKQGQYNSRKNNETKESRKPQKQQLKNIDQIFKEENFPSLSEAQNFKKK